MWILLANLVLVILGSALVWAILTEIDREEFKSIISFTWGAVLFLLFIHPSNLWLAVGLGIALFVVCLLTGIVLSSYSYANLLIREGEPTGVKEKLSYLRIFLFGVLIWFFGTIAILFTMAYIKPYYSAKSLIQDRNLLS